MHVWVLYLDAGCYSDRTWELVGVYATPAGGQAAATAHLAAHVADPGLQPWRVQGDPPEAYTAVIEGGDSYITPREPAEYILERYEAAP